jgi:hypothetical protein
MTTVLAMDVDITIARGISQDLVAVRSTARSSSRAKNRGAAHLR